MLGLLIAAAAAVANAANAGGYAAPECNVAFERFEETRLVLRLRPACPVGFASTQGAVRAILAQAVAPEISVAFGRIERYPWLSDLLKRQGRPPRGKENAYVAAALRAMPEFIGLFDGWQVVGVSVEKVLLNRDKKPYDAILWVRLQRTP
jgi:hypothetical protein